MVSVTHAFVSGIADDPTAAAAGEVLPSHWNATHVVTGIPTTLLADTNYHVATTGSDTTGDGSVGAPWKTLQKAFDVVVTYFLGGFSANIHIADGTYLGVVMDTSNLSGSINFLGNASLVGNVIIQPNFASPAGVCFGLGYAHDAGLYVGIQDLTMSGSGVETGLQAVGTAAIVNLLGNIAFTNLAVCILSSHDSSTYLNTQTLTLSGNATTAFSITDGSSLIALGPSLTVSGTPAYSNAFMQIDNNSIFANSLNMTFSGAATGRKFIVGSGGVIVTGAPLTNNINFFPGSIAGLVDPGGQYDQYSAGAFTDIIDNILKIPPNATLQAFASDIGTSLIADGVEWSIDSSYYTPQADAHDIGALEFSNRIGYGKNYVTDKVLANVSIGFGSETNPMDGQLRHFLDTFFNTEVLQIYQNNEWETLPANITLRDNQSAQNHALEHFPLLNWTRVFSGDSEAVGLNGLPLMQGYQADMGANPAQQQLNGGTF